MGIAVALKARPGFGNDFSREFQKDDDVGRDRSKVSQYGQRYEFIFMAALTNKVLEFGSGKREKRQLVSPSLSLLRDDHRAKMFS